MSWFGKTFLVGYVARGTVVVRKTTDLSAGLSGALALDQGHNIMLGGKCILWEDVNDYIHMAIIGQ